MKRISCFLMMLGLSAAAPSVRAQDAVIDASQYPPALYIEGRPIEIDRELWDDGWEYEFPVGHRFEEVEVEYDRLEDEWEFEFETRGDPGQPPTVLLDDQPIQLERDSFGDDWVYHFPAGSHYSELEVDYDSLQGEWELEFEPATGTGFDWWTDDAWFETWYDGGTF
jgi:hypothetical protein